MTAFQGVSFKWLPREYPSIRLVDLLATQAMQGKIVSEYKNLKEAEDGKDKT